MAVFDAYIDDGGDPSIKMLVNGGYVSRADRWQRFNAEWGALLNEFSVPYIHMKDIFTSSRRYRHLGRANKIDMVERAAGVIRDNADFGMLVVMSSHEYELMTDQKYRIKHGSAFAFSVDVLVGHLIQKLSLLHGEQKSDPPPVLNIWLESGHSNTNEAMIMLEDLREYGNPFDFDSIPDDVLFNPAPMSHNLPLAIGDVRTGTKAGPEARPPLQAADMLVHSYARMASQDGESGDFAQRVLQIVQDKVPQTTISIRGEVMRTIIETSKKMRTLMDEHRAETSRLMGLFRLMGLETERTETMWHVEIPRDYKFPSTREMVKRMSKPK